VEPIEKQSKLSSPPLILDISDRLYNLLLQWIEISEGKIKTEKREQHIQSKARQAEELKNLAEKYGFKLLADITDQKKELLDLIQRDLPGTIQALINKIDLDNSHHNILIYAMFSYNNIQEGLSKGVMKHEEATQEKAKIFNTILDMIKGLHESDLR